MDLFGLDIPTWVLDWSGSCMVVVSLVYLFGKRVGYWYWSNASLVPYFALFVSSRLFMLAGLQATYLVFGIYGLWLWKLEARRGEDGVRFDERVWYRAGWLLSLGIFAFTVMLTQFVDAWAWLEFTIVSASLVANWATTRKWAWSWPVWLGVNVLQAVYFGHFALWGQFLLQFVLFGLSVRGWILWRADDRASRPRDDAEAHLAAA
jgi:nicotinamide mononucleotide transporter